MFFWGHLGTSEQGNKKIPLGSSWICLRCLRTLEKNIVTYKKNNPSSSSNFAHPATSKPHASELPGSHIRRRSAAGDPNSEITGSTSSCSTRWVWRGPQVQEIGFSFVVLPSCFLGTSFRFLGLCVSCSPIHLCKLNSKIQMRSNQSPSHRNLTDTLPFLGMSFRLRQNGLWCHQDWVEQSGLPWRKAIQVEGRWQCGSEGNLLIPCPNTSLECVWNVMFVFNGAVF